MAVKIRSSGKIARKALVLLVQNFCKKKQVAAFYDRIHSEVNKRCLYVSQPIAPDEAQKPIPELLFM